MGNAVAAGMYQEMKFPELNQAEGTNEVYTVPPENLSLGSLKRNSTEEDQTDTLGDCVGRLGKLPDGFQEISSIKMYEGVTEIRVSSQSLELCDETKELNDLQYMEYIKLRGGHWKPHNKEGETLKDHKLKTQTDSEFNLGKVPEHMTSDLDDFDQCQSIDLYSLVENEAGRKGSKNTYDPIERESMSYTVLSELSGLEKQGRNLSPSRSDIRGGSLTGSFNDASSDDSVKDINGLTSGPYTDNGFEKTLPRTAECKESAESITFSPKFFSGQNMLEVPRKSSQKGLRDRVKVKPRAPDLKQVIKTD